MTAIRSNTRLRLRDGLWLIIALLAHGLLFLIPFESPPGKVQPSTALAISLTQLQQENTAASPGPVLPRPEATVPPLPESLPPPSLESEAASEELQHLPPPQTTLRTVTAARLIDSAARMEWQPPESNGIRELGAARPHHGAGRKPGWIHGDNLFDGLAAPTETQILDRWLAADGSHNVVVVSPSGNTYCGRSVAWNPMNPLFEPVMQFRSCGGGGERKFTMPERYRVQRETSGGQPESVLR